MGNALLASFSYLFFGLLSLVWLPVMLLIAAVTWPFEKNRLWTGRSLRFFARLIVLSYPGWRMRIEGDLEAVPRGPFVAVANHESILDVFLVSRVPWEMKWLSKASVFTLPWIGMLFRLSGDIPVVRGDRESTGVALTRAREYLSRGMPVMVFPEGTRSRDGQLLPFKQGAFRLAVELGLPLVPIAVFGTAPGMPVGSPFIRPTRAVARVLETVPVTGLAVNDVPALVERVRERIQVARDELASRAVAPEGRLAESARGSEGRQVAQGPTLE